MSELPAQSPPAMHRRQWLRALGWIACIVVLTLVCRALVVQFRQIPWSQVRFGILGVAAATLCMLGVAGVQLVARWGLLRAYEQKLAWKKLLPASWVPAMGKYLPGSVVSVGAAVVMYRGYGIPGAVGLSVAVLLDALAVLAGFIVSTPLLLWEPVRAKLPLAWLGCVLIILISVVLLHPRVFVGMLNLILRRIGRQPIERTPRASKFLIPLFAVFAQWILSGLGLWFMAISVMTVPIPLIPLFIATSALAMTIGYLTPFAPGGIGIREGLFLLILGPVIGPNVAIVAVAMRVIQTLIEVVLAGIGVWMMRSARAEPISVSSTGR